MTKYHTVKTLRNKCLDDFDEFLEDEYNGELYGYTKNEEMI